MRRNFARLQCAAVSIQNQNIPLNNSHSFYWRDISVASLNFSKSSSTYTGRINRKRTTGYRRLIKRKIHRGRSRAFFVLSRWSLEQHREVSSMRATWGRCFQPFPATRQYMRRYLSLYFISCDQALWKQETCRFPAFTLRTGPSVKPPKEIFVTFLKFSPKILLVFACGRPLTLNFLTP